jgi:FkbM family methyltransferase
MVLSYLKPGATFFDVGAHFGYFTMLAARVVGETGQVHCFEPSPTNFGILRTNTAGKANIIASNVAVFSKPTELRFNDYGLEHSAYSSVYSARIGPGSGDELTPKVFSVQAISLDTYIKQTGSKPDFIKIDAESSELEILNGLTETISICHPIISLEVGDVDDSLKPFASRDIVLWLTERGYEAFQCQSGHISRHLPESHYSYDNLLFVPQK